MFIASCTGSIVALDIETGRELWTYDVDAGYGRQFHGNPVIYEGTIWFGTDQGFAGQEGSLFGIDVENGSLVAHTLIHPGLPSDLRRYKNTLVGVTLDDRLVSFSIESGKLKWEAAGTWTYNPDQITHEDLRLPKLASSCVVIGDRACYAGRDGVLRGVDVKSGTVTWANDLGAIITTQPCVIEGDVVVGTEQHELVYCDAQSGDMGRTQKLPAIALETMSYRDGRLYLLAGFEDANPLYLMCIDPSTGDELWRQAVPPEPKDQYWYVPRLHFWHRAVVVGTTHGLVVAYDEVNGDEQWRQQLDGPLRGIGSTDDLLFVGNLNGKLFALRRLTAND